MSLPPNWNKYTDDSGKEYFHNAQTNVTQWDRPECPVAKEEVYQYKPSSDLELIDRHPVAQASNQTLASPTLDNELVSLHDAPSGRIDAPNAGVGQALVGAANDDGSALSKLFGSVLSYAQDLFDVTTDDVVKRLKLAMLPFPKLHAGEEPADFRGRPDFYGPFWVATTSVLFLAATGNFARLLEMGGDHTKFKAEYSLVSLAAMMIYGCLAAVPAISRFGLYICGEDAATVDLRLLICVYGYALTPAIPCSILCIIPLDGIRWLFVLLALALSVLFLRENLWADIDPKATPLKWLLIALPCVSLASIFFVYRVHFFSQPDS